MLVLKTKNEVINYISANWDGFKHLMTPALLKQREYDPRLWGIGLNNQYKIIKLSGFVQDKKTCDWTIQNKYI